MKEHPIIFNGDMVRAILDERKTETRRVMKPQPEFLHVYDFKGKRLYDGANRRWCWKGHVGGVMEDIETSLLQYSPIKVGDRLWVKETSAYFEPEQELVCGVSYDVSPEVVLYRADLEEDEATAIHWRPSIFMPRWASRITLEVTSFSIQKLQDITWSNAIAEGIKDPRTASKRLNERSGCVAQFQELWDSINLKKHPWESNPWVWVYRFKVLEVKR